MFLLGSYVSGGMFAAGVLILIVTLMRRWQRYYRKSKRNASLPNRARQADRLQPLLDAPPELLRWQVEMHEVARELKGEIDSKLTALQIIIDQARDERERLERSIERAASVGPLPIVEDALNDEAEHEQWRPVASPSETRREIYALADGGYRAEDIARQLDTPIGDVELLLSVRT